jgi:hypothetical protein
MRRPLRISLLVGLAPIVLILLTLAPGLLTVPFTLCFGWISATRRYWAAWHPSLASIIWFAIALATLITGTHSFLHWVYGSFRGQQAGSLPLKWPWRWTFCACGAIACSLLAIICIVLTTHQVYWISESSDPLLVELTYDRFAMRGVSHDLKEAADSEHWDSEKVRTGFYEQKEQVFGSTAVESFEPVWVSDDGQSLRAIILFPRRPLHRSTARIVVLEPGKDNVAHPVTDLNEILKSFGVETNAPGSIRPTLLP